MNEAAAREVLLIRAIETTDHEHRLLSREDREHASRAAAELARWRAAERRRPADADGFVAQRARLLLDRLGERHRALRGPERALAWRHWIDWALPLAALGAGLLFERLADRGQVNVLAFPLLLLLLWNVAVYALVAVGAAAGALRPAAPPRSPRGIAEGLRRVALHALPRGNAGFAAALARFGEDWLAASADLTGARIARVLHLSAALFATGAVVGLYIRGLVFDYRAGWESTFLDAPAVHALLSTLLGPAAQALGQPFPSAEQIAALRFGPGAPGESAARWIHWYALTVAALVIVPRLLLAAAAALRAHRLATRFPVDLYAPYFRRLSAAFDDAPASLRVLPYSYTPDAAAAEGLRAIAHHLLGAQARCDLQPMVAYGAEAEAAARIGGSTAPVAIDAALFSLAATPEQENHGAFLDVLRPRLAAPHLLLVDDGPYRRRLGAQAGSDARLQERRDAWRAFARSRGWTAVFADLAAPDLAALERELGPLAGARR
jgi:hypothetical protein